MTMISQYITDVISGKIFIDDIPADMRERVAHGKTVREDRHAGHSETKNDDGTITVVNDRLRVTLPEAEYRSRYDVFTRAMRTLGNRSELKLLESERPTADEILSRARENLTFEYLSEHCRYNLNETLMRMTGGHRMSAGMQMDVVASRAYATGILEPISAEQLHDWCYAQFQETGTIDQRKLKIEKMKLSTGDAGPALTEALEQILRDRGLEMEYRGHYAGDCENWKIEIIGDMPEQIGMCRFEEPTE